MIRYCDINNRNKNSPTKVPTECVNRYYRRMVKITTAHPQNIHYDIVNKYADGLFKQFMRLPLHQYRYAKTHRRWPAIENFLKQNSHEFILKRLDEFHERKKI